MTKIYLKYKDENKWVGFEEVRWYGNYEDIVSKEKLKPDELVFVENFLSNKHKSLTTHYGIVYPKLKKATSLQKAFLFDYSPATQINEFISFFEARQKYFDLSLHYEKRHYPEQTPFVENLKKLAKAIEAGDLEMVEQSAQNDYVAKKAYAIFAQSGDKSGFRDKSGNMGAISSAKLFDSESAALRAGHCITDQEFVGFDVMEVEVHLKKRTNLKPDFQNAEMDTALAYIEREKINSFLEDVGEAQIEEVLAQRKKHKL